MKTHAGVRRASVSFGLLAAILALFLVMDGRVQSATLTMIEEDYGKWMNGAGVDPVAILSGKARVNDGQKKKKNG